MRLGRLLAEAAREAVPAPVKVLVAHNERLMFEGLVAILNGCGELDVLGVASSAPDAVEKSKVLRPDVLLTDMHLAGADGPETCERVLAAAPGTAVLFLSADDDPTSMQSALNAGAAGFLSTAVPTSELVATILRLSGHEAEVTS